MAETAMVATQNQPEVIQFPNIAGMDKKQLKLTKDLYNQKVLSDLMTANNAVIPRSLLLVSLWGLIEYGNHPNRLWWGYDQHGSTFSASVLQAGLAGVLAPEAIEGMAKLIDAVIPF